jgi:hypothetical protein
MDRTDRSRGSGPSPEQLRYARLLDIAMKAGLAVLVATFVVYVGGALPAQVPFEALPRLWTLPVGDYLAASGMPTGWDWMAMLHRGDVLALTGIALLAGLSVPCLCVLIPTYAARGDWAYFYVTLALVGVLVLAASGVFGSH